MQLLNIQQFAETAPTNKNQDNPIQTWNIYKLPMDRIRAFFSTTFDTIFNTTKTTKLEHVDSQYLQLLEEIKEMHCLAIKHNAAYYETPHFGISDHLLKQTGFSFFHIQLPYQTFVPNPPFV